MFTQHPVLLKKKFQHKRGSFLSRNEKVLQKLAEITKSASEPVIGGAKNSKKFIFQTVQRIENANVSLIFF